MPLRDDFNLFNNDTLKTSSLETIHVGLRHLIRSCSATVSPRGKHTIVTAIYFFFSGRAFGVTPFGDWLAPQVDEIVTPFAVKQVEIVIPTT